MNSDLLALGFLEYVVFLLSTTCHEASHSLVALWGGDRTALEGGQVSLNPLPHIRREPFGMVIMPLLGIVTQAGLIGWASAPYNSQWAQQYPKRAARMSLAGPAANFTIAILAGILMRIGLAAGVFVPTGSTFTHIVGAASQGGIAEAVATALSIFFSLNILLGGFNLIPFPPLDGYGILGLFTTESGARRLQQLRLQMRTFAILGLVLAWRAFDVFYYPLFNTAIHAVYAGYRF
jgi:Zn-dependent protease